MADLEQARRLQQSLFKKPEITSQDIVNYATSKTLDQMMERLSQPSATTDELQKAVETLGKGLKILSKQIKETQAAVEMRPTSYDPVLKALEQLQSNVQQFVNAVANIRLPEYPKIPEPKDVDLSPVLERQGALEAMLANFTPGPTSVQMEPPPPRSWTFDVKRNQSGLIKSVEVNEQ